MLQDLFNLLQIFLNVYSSNRIAPFISYNDYTEKLLLKATSIQGSPLLRVNIFRNEFFPIDIMLIFFVSGYTTYYT